MDSVSDRDYLLEFLSALSILMMHLSRFSEELIIWNSNEYRFVEIDDAYSTGSSIMPQKKNPDIAELTRGKAGRAYGNLITLLSMLNFMQNPINVLDKINFEFTILPVPKLDENQKEYRVGTVGTDARWEAPYVRASLVVTDAEAIRAIEDGSMRELSCAYRYDPLWEAGTFQGVDYDFIMSNMFCSLRLYTKVMLTTAMHESSRKDETKMMVPILVLK